jgi:transketolase
LIKDLEKKSKWIRQRIVKICSVSKAGHITSSFSSVEILVSLYLARILRYDVNKPNWEDRDRFISKGHSTLAFYTVLAEAGYFPHSDVNSFCTKGTIFGCLTTTSVPGVECYTGSLGHGLSYAVGQALSARLKRKNFLVYVHTGDGECQEGSIWEAAMSISKYKLTNIIWIIDRNEIQLTGRVKDTMNIDPFKEKLVSFGFDTKDVDGHNLKELITVLSVDRDNLPSKPLAIIANTVKGKGSPFLEHKLDWHNRKPNSKELKIILNELDISDEEFLLL